jgi:hypothetical protein
MKNLEAGLVFASTLLLCAFSGASAQMASATLDPALAAVFANRSVMPVTRLQAQSCFVYCDTASTSTTAIVAGAGPDCTSAESSLTSQLKSIADADCENSPGYPSCAFTLHVTKECHLTTTGIYKVKGYATYSCKDLDCGTN